MAENYTFEKANGSGQSKCIKCGTISWDCFMWKAKELYDKRVCYECKKLLESEVSDNKNVQEVKHGKWTKANERQKSYIIRCSACGKSAYFIGKSIHYKFCPNCGANMVGGE